MENMDTAGLVMEQMIIYITTTKSICTNGRPFPAVASKPSRLYKCLYFYRRLLFSDVSINVPIFRDGFISSRL
jgi:hypothetical protein